MSTDASLEIVECEAVVHLAGAMRALGHPLPQISKVHSLLPTSAGLVQYLHLLGPATAHVCSGAICLTRKKPSHPRQQGVWKSHLKFLDMNMIPSPLSSP